jgi:hypothetical protein
VTRLLGPGGPIKLVRNRNGRFDAAYRDRHGKVQWTRTFATEKEAKASAVAARAIEKSGRNAKRVLAGPEILYPDDVRGSVTVAGYADDWLAPTSGTPPARPTGRCCGST